MNVAQKTVVSAFAAACALVMLLFPATSRGEDLSRQVETMVGDFAPIIESLPGKEPFLVAAGPFFDPGAQTREVLCRDAENLVFSQVLKRFSDSGRAVIVDWKRPAPLKAVKDAASGSLRYKLSDAMRHLEGFPLRGYLITGYADAPGGSPRLRALLVAIPEGTVARRFGPPVTAASQGGSMQAEELSAMKAAPASASAPSEQKPPEPQQAAATAGGGLPKAAVLPAATAAAETAAPVVSPAPAASPEAIAPETSPAEKAAPAPGQASPASVQAALSSTVVEGKNFRYEGQVDADGKKQGHGTLTFDSGDRYAGQWEDDRMNGEGTYLFSDGDKYVGQWRDNKMNGRGTYYYRNGDRYTGRFSNDVKDGPGIYHFKNGDRWEGSYLNGQKHGKAVYIWSNGKKKEELWNLGQKVE